MATAPSDDPASRLLAGAAAGPGSALLVECGPEVLAACAPRFTALLSQNSTCSAHALSRELSGLGPTVHCRLGDIPNAADEKTEFDAVLYRLGRAAAQAQALIREAFRLLRPGGSLWVAGHNREGIKSFAGKAEGHFGNVEVVKIKSSCRLLRFRKQSVEPVQAVPDPGYFEYQPQQLTLPDGRKLAYATKPGIFSYRATDAGTALLARQLPDCTGRQVLDLGCGSGVLSLAAFQLGARGALAVDASVIAVACAERNFREQGLPGQTLCADFIADRETPGLAGEFDLILSNPPFHQGSAADLSLPEKILDVALLHLKPEGEIYLVANQFLDYRRRAQALFAEVSVLDRAQGYCVYRMKRLLP